MQVLIYERAFQRIRAQLSERLPQVEPLLMGADGTLSLAGTQVAPEQALARAAWASSDLYAGGPVRDFMIACLKSQSLRWVQSGGAGFEHPVFARLVDKGIALSVNTAGSIAIAEFVIAAVLDELQPQQQRRELQLARRWQRTPFREVFGTTWLIVGVGSIGSELARRARAFGARVIGVRRTPSGEEPVDRMITPPALPEVLPACDVIALCAAQNPDSQRIVNAAFLSRMKRGSLLVNIARGTLVDEPALLQSLERGIPECAILDVFAQEPLPQESPLWTHPRVRVSAHNAANGLGYIARGDAQFLDNLQRFAAGERPLQLADPESVKRSSQ